VQLALAIDSAPGRDHGLSCYQTAEETVPSGARMSFEDVVGDLLEV